MLQQLKKFPFGFIVCCLSFTFERLAYYTGKWGIAIFVVLEAANGGLGLDRAMGPIFSAQIVAWTYITPIIGGYIADRWISPRWLVPFGELLMAAGWFSIAFAKSPTGVWLCVILVAVGTGFFKGNVSGINGRQFASDKATLTTAFSFQYMFVNVGSFIGTTFITLIATVYGQYRTMFIICAVAMVVDVLWWLFGMKYLGDAGKRPFKVDNRVEDVDNADEEADLAPLTKLERNRVTAIVVLTFLSGLFWLFWYLLYMPVYYEFGPAAQGGMGWANWNLGSFEMPTAWFDSSNALLCIILAPTLAAFWLKLSKSKRGDLSMLTKTALGIMLLGLGIAAMVLGAIVYKNTGRPVGIWIIILTSLCCSVGEMLFSPLGNSFISEYAPKKYLGTLLGLWPFIIFFAGLAYGPLYNAMRVNFISSFTIAAIIIFAAGFVLLAFVKKFERMIDGPTE
ncbi:MAG: peptide MFS transporter [Clostridiales bacterium]|nr:peptide MFS transporter [Clostridiales bacterium]